MLATQRLRFIAGKTQLRVTSQRLLARAFECTEAELHQPIGTPIPDPTDGQPMLRDHLASAARFKVVLRALGVAQPDDLARYVLWGDYSGLSARVTKRFRDIQEARS